MSNKAKRVGTLIRTNFLFYLLSVVLLSALLVIIGSLSYLQTEANVIGEQIKDVFDGKNLYTVTDSLLDPKRFSEYRENVDNINKIGNFYNLMSTSFDFLSMFHQPIPVENFRGGNQFIYNSDFILEKENVLPLNIKCFQINQAAFNFYKLKLWKGDELPWHDIDYNNLKIPILMGFDYKGIYEIGDSFVGNFYSKNFEFVVTGLLNPNSFVHYKGNPEFYLDQYIILPYPEECKPIYTSDFFFEGILYFAMINGDLASESSEDNIIHKIKQIADETDFNEFTVIGLPEFSTKHSEMISVIKENRKLLYNSVVLLSLLIGFVQYGIAQMILAKKKDVYKAYWLIGYSGYREIYLRDISISYPCALILANILLIILFHDVSFSAIISTSLITIIILMISSLSCMRLLNKTTQKVMQGTKGEKL